MASLNSVSLIGRVGRDPETRQFENGGKIATFTLATDESYKDRNGQRHDATEWHSIVLNGKLADLAQYIRKGSQLYIGGKIRTRSYEYNGETKYATEVVALSVQLLDPRSDNAQQAPQAPAQAPQYPPQPQVAPPQYAPQPQAAPPAQAPAPAPQPNYQAPAPPQQAPVTQPAPQQAAPAPQAQTDDLPF